MVFLRFARILLTRFLNVVQFLNTKKIDRQKDNIRIENAATSRARNSNAAPAVQLNWAKTKTSPNVCQMLTFFHEFRGRISLQQLLCISEKKGDISMAPRCPVMDYKALNLVAGQWSSPSFSIVARIKIHARLIIHDWPALMMLALLVATRWQKKAERTTGGSFFL